MAELPWYVTPDEIVFAPANRAGEPEAEPEPEKPIKRIIEIGANIEGKVKLS